MATTVPKRNIKHHKLWRVERRLIEHSPRSYKLFLLVFIWMFIGIFVIPLDLCWDSQINGVNIVEQNLLNFFQCESSVSLCGEYVPVEFYQM